MHIPSVSMEGRFPFRELRNEILYVAVEQDWAGIICMILVIETPRDKKLNPLIH